VALLCGVNTAFTRAKNPPFGDFSVGAGETWPTAAGVATADAVWFAAGEAAGASALACCAGALAEAQDGQPTPKHGPELCQAHPASPNVAAPNIISRRRFFMLCPLRTHPMDMWDIIGRSSSYPV
jgi:hypothetical protein